MPVFNAEKFLEDSIGSILDQTYKNFEFLIFNDGSTDGSLKIIRKYEALDSRIHVISKPQRGLIACLNEGFFLSKGVWICKSKNTYICEVN